MSEKLLLKHLIAVGERNLEKIMEDYTEESVLMIPSEMYVGLDRIKLFFGTMFDLLPEGSEINLTDRRAEGNMGFVVWNAESDKIKVPFATDTIIFENGKIKYHSIGFISGAK